MIDILKHQGKKCLSFLASRKVILENSSNKIIFDLQIVWCLLALLFFSGIVITAIIISLLLGYKISVVDSKPNIFR